NREKASLVYTFHNLSLSKKPPDLCYILCLAGSKSLTLHLSASDRVQYWMSPPHQVTENQQQEEDDLIKPKKLINPILASLQQRALHQELLFCHKQGFLPRKKSELHRVLENKAREQLRKREQALRPRSDLEVKLQRRRQKLELYELEEKRWRAGLKNVPEFIHVRQTLRHVPHSS
ncbi:PREDICTED: protein FAM107B-like, partial [Cyprinodon variegatus]|uniref:protein FAM107B-like n=1 Tax=Cyprinodon variegatus TaxID=28743 RepID=UPI0007424EAA